MRFVIWLSVPVLIFCVAVLATILVNWTQGVPLCGSWFGHVLPVCG